MDEAKHLMSTKVRQYKKDRLQSHDMNRMDYLVQMTKKLRQGENFDHLRTANESLFQVSPRANSPIASQSKGTTFGNTIINFKAPVQSNVQVMT